MTAPGPPRAAAGRPKDAAKRAAILAEARTMFFERGLEAVTIEGVAAAAGVSRMTVYGHFGDKDALFAAVIAAEGRQVARALSALCCVPPGPGGGDLADLRATLEAFGRDLLGFLAQPDIRAWNRLLEAEAPRHPELARAFVEQGPRAVARALAERLRLAAEAGLLDLPALARAGPGKAGRHLLGLLRGIEGSAVSLGLAPPPAAAEIAEHAAECVEVFLRAYARHA